MKCPMCGKKFDASSSEDKPFCSERCREIDLGNWFTEGYTIPAVELEDEEVTELERAIEEKHRTNE